MEVTTAGNNTTVGIIRANVTVTAVARPQVLSFDRVTIPRYDVLQPRLGRSFSSSDDRGRKVHGLRRHLSALVSRRPSHASRQVFIPTSASSQARLILRVRQSHDFVIDTRSKSATSAPASIPIWKMIRNGRRVPMTTSLGPPGALPLHMHPAKISPEKLDTIPPIADITTEKLAETVAPVTSPVVPENEREETGKAITRSGEPSINSLENSQRIKRSLGSPRRFPVQSFAQSQNRHAQVQHINSMLNEISRSRQNISVGNAARLKNYMRPKSRTLLRRGALNLRESTRIGDGLGEYSEDDLKALIRNIRPEPSHRQEA